jgi:hypothetical protein
MDARTNSVAPNRMSTREFSDRIAAEVCEADERGEPDEP